jgi:DNA uptake protein ComE-like DNA-binding protein
MKCQFGNGKNFAKFLMLFALLLSKDTIFAQVADTTGRGLSEKIILQIESIAENLEESVDFTDLVDAYYYFSENKISINGPDVAELRNLYLISDFQLESLQKYLLEFGPMLTVFELSMVEGFDEKTVSVLMPVITTDIVSRTQSLKPKNVLKWGRHQLLLRTEKVLEAREGYKSTTDSALWDKPNSRYLGGPEKLYARYSFNYRNRVRAGLTMEKDAGEVFFDDNVNDSLQRLLGNKLRSGFDFYSAHAFLKDVGPIRSMALGDYHLAFGQGLTMWTGLAFGKSTEPSGVIKYGQGVRPNTSVNESLFLRGGAATIGWKQFEFTAFYSMKDIDANIDQVDSVSNEVFTITSLQETGLHRTVSELLKKGSISQTVFGGRTAFKSKRVELGYTLHRTQLGASLVPRIYPYNQFRFMARELTNQGFDFRVVYPQMIFFGEIGRSDNGGMAGIAGVTAQPAGFVSITLAYRDYQRNYQNLFSNAFSEGTLSNNERGIYAGISAGLAPGWKLSAYADHFTFPWFRFSADGPSYGYDYYAQLDHRISRKADVYMRFRTKRKMTNDNNEWNTIDHLVNYTKNTLRFHVNYAVSSSFALKNRAELISYNEENKENSYGFIIYQDILFRPPDKPYELTFRYAVFDADTYDSRVYTYENDVLYAFSIPAFYQKGTRMYLLFRLKAHKSVDLWARIAQTWYSDRSTIGSGLELIEGNKKTDFKLQLRFKF